jgi:hypothetical protein
LLSADLALPRHLEDNSVLETFHWTFLKIIALALKFRNWFNISA